MLGPVVLGRLGVSDTPGHQHTRFAALKCIEVLPSAGAVLPSSPADVYSSLGGRKLVPVSHQQVKLEALLV